MNAFDEFESWRDMTRAVIHVMQILITAGIGFRIIRIVQSAREEEMPWSKIGKQVKGHVLIVIISLVISELVNVFLGYYR